MNEVIDQIQKETELVELLRRQDQKALASLYDNYSKALYGVIVRIVDSEEIAEDVLQESFVKVWKSILSYDKTKGRLFTWLVNIARNTAIDKVRSKDFQTGTRIQSLDNSVYHINARYNTSTEVDHIGLRKVVDKLKPEHLVLVDMIYFKGYTQAEVADELKIPLGTVKTRIKSAMNQLRQALT